MVWYEQWFDRDEYELVYRERDESDASNLLMLILELASLQRGARILDMGCGRGRHAIALAAQGFQMTGLDLSGRALAQAKSRADAAGVEVSFVQGDMREEVEAGGFDAVINLFTAFGYFEAAFDHQRAVDAMAGALRPGGILIQDFLNAEYVRTHLRPEDRTQLGDVVIHQRRWIEEGRIKKEIVFEGAEESHSFVESVALLERPDFERMYAAAGLTEFAVRGDYDGRPFSEDSPRLILFSRRAPETQ